MYIKIHKSYRTIVALCDENLLGKRFESEKFQLDIRETFFKGHTVSEEEAEKILKAQLLEDATFNIIGEKSVNLAVKLGIADKNKIGVVQKIPFALVF